MSRTFTPDEIAVGRTYRSRHGKLLYVHDIQGERITFCHVGSVDRLDRPLRAFAALISEEVPNV